jgi:hypothetical protein
MEEIRCVKENSKKEKIGGWRRTERRGNSTRVGREHDYREGIEEKGEQEGG